MKQATRVKCSITLPNSEMKTKKDKLLEVEAMRKTIVEKMQAILSQYLNKHNNQSTIWYPNHYAQYLKENGMVPMPESLSTGHANEEFSIEPAKLSTPLVVLPALDKSPSEELSNYGKVIIASLRAMMADELSGQIEGNYRDVVLRKPKSSPTVPMVPQFQNHNSLTKNQRLALAQAILELTSCSSPSRVEPMD